MIRLKKDMNNKQALYLLWSTILNQSQVANGTLDKTLDLFERLNLNKNFLTFFKQSTYEKVLESILRKPVIHRFPNRMAEYLYFSIQFIIRKYKNNPYLVFENFNSFFELKTRLMEFRGIGEHKANIAVCIFKKFIKEEDFIINEKNNCSSLFFTLDKEMCILSRLKEE